MDQAGLSGSEPRADLSAWLAKITARLSGLMALSLAVCITNSLNSAMAKLFRKWFCGVSSQSVTVSDQVQDHAKRIIGSD